MARANSSIGWAPASGVPLMRKDGVELAPRPYASSWSFFTAAFAASLSRSAANRAASGTPASPASSLSRSAPNPFSLAPCAYAAAWNCQNLPCRPAAHAPRAAASDSAPKIGKLRHSMRRVPSSTYFFTRAGSVSRANLPQ